MITVDRIDISHYFLYARRVRSVEETYRLYRMEQAHAIPAHTKVVNVKPQFAEVDIIFGFRRSTQPWACFSVPLNYDDQRRSSFAFDRVCPSLGTMERQLEELQKLKRSLDDDERESQPQGDDQEERNDSEKSKLFRCLDKINNLNNLINFVTSRIGQFLQG